MSISDKLLKSAAAGGLTPSENFKTVIYTGNGGTQAITGVGFQPDYVWIKTRNAANDHALYDSTRGPAEMLHSQSDVGEQSQGSNGLQSFDTDGFTVVDNAGGGSGVNGNYNYVAWCWKANGGTTSSNTSGSITSTVQVNDDAGFSIVEYTGNSTAGATVGHGFSSAPQVVIIKCTSTSSTNWINYYETIGDDDYLTLNLSNAVDSYTNWFYSNATTFTLNQIVNALRKNHIALPTAMNLSL